MGKDFSDFWNHGAIHGNLYVILWISLQQSFGDAIICLLYTSTEIQIMRLVGAKNSYIRRPYLMEGAWIGALGAIIPSGLIYLLYHMVSVSYTHLGR